MITKTITKTEVHKGTVGLKKGWAFSVYWDNRPYPNFISPLVKTKIGAQRNLAKYLKTERNLAKYLKTAKFSLYGNAE